MSDTNQASSVGGTTPGWSLYGDTSSSALVPYVPGYGVTDLGQNPPRLKVAVSVDGTGAQDFVIDTGSNGMVMPRSALPADLDLSHGTPGVFSYGSSGITLNGTWVPLSVSFPDAQGASTAETVPVLVVTSVTGPNVSPGYEGPFMMGVGFGCPPTDDAGNTLTTANNPFLNLPGMKDGTVHAGYVLATDGVHLGLTDADAGSGWAYSQLTPLSRPVDPASGAADWARAPTVLTVGDHASQTGSMLVDTGLTRAMVGFPTLDAADLSQVVSGGETTTVLASGVPVSVDLLGTGTDAVGYGYTVGGGSSQTPVQSDRDGSRTYINTTGRVLSGFDYLYDPVTGVVGFRPNDAGTDTDQSFTAVLASGGTLALPASFGTDLPVILRSDTTVTTSGTATFSGSISGSAALTASGAGTLALSGVSSFTGGVVLDGASLVLSSGQAAGTGAITTAAGTSNAITVSHGGVRVVGGGQDTVSAAEAGSTVTGGQSLLFLGAIGGSTVGGGAGSATVLGGAGGLYQGGAAGQNQLFSTGGGATLAGGGAGDLLVGGAGDVLLAAAGNATLFAGTGSTVADADGSTAVLGGAATVFGSAGQDTMYGGAQDVLVLGGSGATTVVGGAGALTAMAGAGSLTEFGGSGGGTLVAGSGSATLVVGTGAQTLEVLAGHAGGAISVTGFRVGTDQIALAGYDPATLGTATAGGALTLTLPDATTITLAGIAPGSLAVTSF